MVKIYETSKGSKYVYGFDLYLALKIDKNFKDWLSEMISYDFEISRDYVFTIREMKTDQEDWKEYQDAVIKMDMAKTIAILHKSKEGKGLRNQLIKIEKEVSEGELLNRQQILALMDFIKVFGFFSVQDKLEKKHFEIFNRPNQWWKYRANLLGYSSDDLKNAITALNIKYKNRQQALFHLDKYELIRRATIDLFMILGKSEEFARNLGRTAKEMAKEIDPEIYNDEGPIDFKSQKQKALIVEISNIDNPGNTLKEFN